MIDYILEVIFMGLIQKIKQLVNRKTPRLETSYIVGYHTSLVYIPEYSKLLENEKNVVDNYISEIDMEKLENVISYGNTVYKYANTNTDLLVGLFYRLTENQSDWNLNKMQEQDMLQERLNQMIMIEELELYKTALRKLEEEATLRTVALEEIYKRKKKEARFWGIFERAERLERKNQQEKLQSAIERMKINKKMIEEQLQSITNTMHSGRTSNPVY